MKNFILSVAFLSAFCLPGCGFVSPGHVGVVINSWGSGSGVSPEAMTSGAYMYNPLTTRVEEFPTSRKTLVFSQSLDEGNSIDESITFNDKNGISINADMAMEYAFIPEDVPNLYSEIRMNPDDIGHKYLRTRLRDRINEASSKYTVIEIFGESRHTLVETAKKVLDEELRVLGIDIKAVSFLGKLRVSSDIEQSINSVLMAAQKTAAVTEEVNQKNKMADAILYSAQKEAEANDVMAKSVTPELLKYKALEKWDGVLPRMTGSEAIPFISIDDK